MLSIFRRTHRHEPTHSIYRAWECAVRAHSRLYLKGDRRKNGDPYLYHPLEVGTILAEWEMDAATLAAGLLHDCAEDTEVNIDEIRDEFGEIIAGIVDGVTKVKGAPANKAAEQAAYTRKMLRAMRREIRVAFVKLADRLHNMRTLDAMPDDKRRRIARETSDLYCPLAHTLGLAAVRRELEDLAFNYTDPDRYASIQEAVKRSEPAAKRQLRRIVSKIKREMAKGPRPIGGTVRGRLKSVFSIHEYLESKAWSPDDLGKIKNFLKVIVVCQEESDAYRLLRPIHDGWIQYELGRDGIAEPRRNGFKALMEWRKVKGGYPFEVQISTAAQYRTAEFGIAADWHYKSDQNVSIKFEKSLAGLGESLRELLKIKNDQEFLEAFRSELNSDEIFVYSTIGQRFYLRKSAVALDFAYKISSELGHQATSCRINDIERPLSWALGNGDRIEIIRRQGSTPSEEWLGFVKTRRAIQEIRHKLNKAKPGNITATH